VFTYKDKPRTVQQVGQELGVQFLLEGSVRKAGSRVRVTGQLVSTEEGEHIWAERFDRDLTDIFAIQDEITHAIVEQLKVKLLPQEKNSIEQNPTDNVEAYTYYLRGRQFLHRHSKSYYHLARRMFIKSNELDPRYARAYAGIADCDSFLLLHYHVDVPVAGFWRTPTKPSLWIIGWQRRTGRADWRSPLKSDLKNR
jgi:adenylate cyclase